MSNEIQSHTVNKVIYIVLAFFLGTFGVHKFYARRTLEGVLFLLFCWTSIPSILSIISCVVTLFTPADNNGNIQAGFV